MTHLLFHICTQAKIIRIKMFKLFHNFHKLLYFLGVLISLPSVVLSMSERECAIEAGSPDYCVCSLSSAIDDIIKIVKGSQVESHLASFRCSHFVQLPVSLTKAAEYYAVSEEKNEPGLRHHKSRGKRFINPEIVLTATEQEPVEMIYEYPRYPMDTEFKRRGARYRNRVRRESFFQFPTENEPMRVPELARHHRSKRQVALGVPSPPTFLNAVAKMPSPKELHQYVPLGASANLLCFCLDRNLHLKKWGRRMKFTWTNSDGKEITTSQMAVDQRTGTLTIYSVQLQDSDIYNCTVDFMNKDSGIIDHTETFTHQIDVVSEPAFWLQVSVNYITDSDGCFKEEIYDIEKSITPWVHAYACENCEVRNVSVMCEHNEGETRILTQFIVTTMGIESKIPSLKFGISYSCPITCSEKLHLKLLEIISASLTKVFVLPIMLTDNEGEPIWYESDTTSMTTTVVEGCLSGFFQAFKLCFPCDVGKYSPNGKVECMPCPRGTYQNRQGSSGCIQCPSGLSTLTTGSTMEFSCIIPGVFNSLGSFLQNHWVLVLIIFILISIILKAAIFLCCFPASKITQYIKMVLCCCGCFYDCGDGCKNCFKRPELPKSKSSEYKKLKREQSLLLTTDETTDSDITPNVRNPRKYMKDKLKSLERKARNFIPKIKSRKLNINESLHASESKVNAVGASSKLIRSVPKNLQKRVNENDDDEEMESTSSADMKSKYKNNTLPEKNSANDEVIEQIKTIRNNLGGNLKSKTSRKQHSIRV